MSSDHNHIRILIADEQPSFRSSLRTALESEGDVEVLSDVSEASVALRLVSELKPDILLVELALARHFESQGPNGFGTHSSPVRVVAMVTAIEKPYIVDAFRLGAHGIVLRSSTSEMVLRSIRSVMAGYYWLDNKSVEMLVEVLRESLAQGSWTTSPKDYGLTPRELDIIAKIANGRSNREVGREFSISERTVKHHLTNIFTKIGVSSRLQLALFAFNHRLMAEHGPSVETDGLQPDQPL